MIDIVLSDAIITQLGKGKSHAVKGKILAQRLGFKGTRSIRMAIVELRHQNYPIIGGQSGYFIAETPQEITEAQQYLLSYIRDLCIDLRDLKRIKQGFVGQLSMRL